MAIRACRAARTAAGLPACRSKAASEGETAADDGSRSVPAHRARSPRAALAGVMVRQVITLPTGRVRSPASRPTLSQDSASRGRRKFVEKSGNVVDRAWRKRA